jgi:hypothetical protein
MNSVVEELSTLVGGKSSTQQISRRPGRVNGSAQNSDHVLHQIAAGRPQTHQETRPVQRHASTRIPLDDDMSGFNA